jgi:hypothetical protein
MKVKDLINLLSNYNNELDIVVCDASSSYDEDMDLFIGDDIKAYPCTRSGTNDITYTSTNDGATCLALSVSDFYLDPYI